MDVLEKAQEYFKQIGYGHINAILRPSHPDVDRTFRGLVEWANNNGDCIINVGDGYYRPVPKDPVDALEFRQYLSMESARANKITRKHNRMKAAFKAGKERKE